MKVCLINIHITGSSRIFLTSNWQESNTSIYPFMEVGEIFYELIMNNDEIVLEKVLQEFSEKLPKFEDGRID